MNNYIVVRVISTFISVVSAYNQRLFEYLFES